MKTLADGSLLHTDALTVTGKTVADNLEGAEVYNDDVIRPLDNPLYAEGALAVLRGNIAPGRARSPPDWRRLRPWPRRPRSR